MAIDVQNALVDLPNLGAGLVSVTQNVNSANNKVYSIKFSADLGDVSLLAEVSGNVNSTIAETVKGSPTGKLVQLNMQNNISTGPFKLTDTSSNVDIIFCYYFLYVSKTKIAFSNIYANTYLKQIQAVVTQAFGIRCPQSILTGLDVFSSNDFETCGWTNDLFSQTVFCGKCSRINSEGLVYAINSPLTYKYVSLNLNLIF